jgi:hypothetical protein
MHEPAAPAHDISPEPISAATPVPVLEPQI